MTWWILEQLPPPPPPPPPQSHDQCIALDAYLNALRLGILLYPPVFTSLSRDINYFSYVSTSLVYITIHKNKIKTKITGDKKNNNNNNYNIYKQNYCSEKEEKTETKQLTTKEIPCSFSIRWGKQIVWNKSP